MRKEVEFSADLPSEPILRFCPELLRRSMNKVVGVLEDPRMVNGEMVWNKIENQFQAISMEKLTETQKPPLVPQERFHLVVGDGIRRT